MKLYATTTSERASKGQGGNDFIEILVQDEKRETLFFMEIQPSKDNTFTYRMSVDDKLLSRSLDETKGKKQKGEHIECEQCGEQIPITRDVKGNIVPEDCPFCK